MIHNEVVHFHRQLHCPAGAATSTHIQRRDDRQQHEDIDCYPQQDHPDRIEKLPHQGLDFELHLCRTR